MSNVPDATFDGCKYKTLEQLSAVLPNSVSAFEQIALLYSQIKPIVVSDKTNVGSSELQCTLRALAVQLRLDPTQIINEHILGYNSEYRNPKYFYMFTPEWYNNDVEIDSTALF